MSSEDLPELTPPDEGDGPPVPFEAVEQTREGTAQFDETMGGDHAFDLVQQAHLVARLVEAGKAPREVATEARDEIGPAAPPARCEPAPAWR